MTKTTARWLLFVLLVACTAIIVKTNTTYAAPAAPTTLDVVPALYPGQSVVGLDALLPHLNIETKSGNDVQFLLQDEYPLAFGANKGGGFNQVNGCLFQGWGFADMGNGSGNYSTKTHDYVFTFTPGMTVSDFTISVADWGDFLPNGLSPDGHYGMTLSAYNAAGDLVAADTLSFTSLNNSQGNRLTAEFGDLFTAGDACTAVQFEQPGNYTFNVRGSGITRIELNFDNPQSIDPNIALHNPMAYQCEACPPLGANDSGTTGMNQSVTLPVLANDTDPNGDQITITGNNSISSYGGTVTCTTTTCTYKPPFLFTGTDTFSYTLCDSFGLCATAKVTVQVVYDPADVASSHCVNTQGYWKTHSNPAQSRYDATWNQYPEGGDTPFFLSGQTYLEVMKAPTRTNAYYSLGQQYIAAELNLRRGSSAPQDVLDAFNTAMMLYDIYTPADVAGNATLRAEFIALNGILDAYNNGLKSPAHCQ